MRLGYVAVRLGYVGVRLGYVAVRLGCVGVRLGYVGVYPLDIARPRMTGLINILLFRHFPVSSFLHFLICHFFISHS